jgi:hypothetical protein
MDQRKQLNRIYSGSGYATLMKLKFLEFNSKLSWQVEESPLKDEIQSGSIVVGEAAPAQAQHRPSKGARKRKS